MVRRKRFNLVKWVLVGLFLLFGLCILAYNVKYQLSTGSESVFVREKWIKYQGSTAKYLVSTDRGVFSVSDSWLRLQWRSSDLYGCLQPNQSYNIEYYGFRFGFFSDYPNIYRVDGCVIP